MTSIKAVLRKTKLANGRFPISLPVTKNRRSKFFKTPYTVLEKEWNPINQNIFALVDKVVADMRASGRVRNGRAYYDTLNSYFCERLKNVQNDVSKKGNFF